MVPVITPVVALVVIVDLPATGAELAGAMVGVTVAVVVPPCASEIVMVNGSVLAVVEDRAEVRAAGVGVR